MGVKVRFRKGAWWVTVNYIRMRNAKRVGSEAAAELVAAYPALAGLRQSTLEGYRRMLKLHAYLGMGGTT